MSTQTASRVPRSGSPAVPRIPPVRPGPRLLIVAVAVAVVLASVTTVVALRAAEDARDRVQAEALLLNRAAAAQAHRFLDDRIDLLQTIASSPAVRDVDPERIRAFFDELPAISTDLVDMAWIDDAGRVRARSLSPSSETFDAADRPYFQVVRDTLQPYVSGILPSRQPGGTPVVAIAVPTFDGNGGFTGVLANTIALDRLDRDLQNFRLGRTGELLVVDQDGMLIADGDPLTGAVDVSGTPLFQRARSERSNVLSDAGGLRGRDGRLVAFSPVPAAGWTVFLDQSLEEAYAPATAALAWTFTGLAAAIVAGMSGALWAAQRLDRLAIEEERASRSRDESLALLLTLLDGAPVGLAFLDRDHRLVRVNDALTVMTGLPAAEHLGRRIDEVRPVLAPLVTPHLQRVLATGCPVRDVELSSELPEQPGRARSLLASYYPVTSPDGAVLGVGIVVVDVTAQVRAEQRQRFLAGASEALTASLDLDTTLDRLAGLSIAALADYCLIDVLRPDGTVARMAGAHRDPDRQALIDAARSFPPSVQGGGPAARAIQTGQLQVLEANELARNWTAQSPEHRAIIDQLQPRYVVAAPLLVRGQPVGSAMLVRVDGSPPFEPDELALVEELARRAATAVENARLYHQAQDALRLRDEFLASISHDLRTPLTSIKGFTQLAMRVVARSAATEAERSRIIEGLTRVDMTATRMAAQVLELLEVSRMEAGRDLDLNREPTDLVALARRQISEQQQTAPGHQIRLETSAPEVIGDWDPVRIDRVIANLLSNAIKYSPDGGPVLVRVTSGAELAELTVSDQGMGIPAADLPRIFERFHRGGNVATHLPGTGIGLAGVRYIVEQHGGEVQVESTEGEGTTVRVCLPLRAPVPDAGPLPA